MPVPGSVRLVPASGRLRARAATDTARVPTPLLQPLLRTQSHFAVQFGAGIFAVDEVAESAAHAPFSAIQSTTRFSEIGDR